MVHWVNASSVSQFRASYRRIGENLRLSKKKIDNEDVLELVHDIMRRDVGGQWLMVLDGLDDKARLVIKDDKGRERSILDFVPKAHRARILTTTRSRSLAMEMVAKKADCVIDVKALPDGDASYLLYGSEVTDDAKKKGAADVSKKLGGSAGLLVLAHIYRTAIGQKWRPKAYLDSIGATPESKDGEDPALKAWELIYQIVKEKDANAAHLLLLMGSLDVQAISTVLFDRPEWKQIDQLVNYGMVEPSTDRRLYTVTPLIRRYVQKWLVKNKEQDHVRDHALSVVCEKFPNDDNDTAELLMPCALAIEDFQPVSAEAKRNMASLMFKVGQHHVRTRRRLVGLGYLKKCLLLQENDKGTKSEDIQTTKKAIADAEAQEKQEAKDMKAQPPKKREDVQLEKARAELSEMEKQKGKDHDEVVDKASKLADILALRENEGDQAEALKIYQRKAKHLKDNGLEGHIDMARNQFNQACVYENTGQLDKAMELYQSSPQIFERHLGPGHPEMLRSFCNMGSLYCRQGQMEEGKRILGNTLQNQIKTLGQDHPDTLVTRRNIAMVGESDKAEAAFEELTKIMELQERLHLEPAMLQTLCSMAGNYMKREMYKEAREMLEATLASQEAILGKTHRDTNMTRINLKELEAADKIKSARPQKKEKTPVIAQVSAKC
jgi:tetratricopeptide (TPR) repeat protein